MDDYAVTIDHDTGSNGRREPDGQGESDVTSANGMFRSVADRLLRDIGGRLLRSYPTLKDPLLVGRDRYARMYVWLRTLDNRRRYAAPPEPYRLLSVDPARIERRRQFNRSKFSQTAVVADGDWDRDGEVARFADLDVYRAYVAHFVDGVPWEDTEFYDRVVDEIRSGIVRWNCHTESEFRERCDHLDELYETIRTEGYRSQSDLAERRDEDPIDLGRRSSLLTERMKDEIAVHIDRDGEFLFADGRNRLSIAKILGLDAVPVRVLRRHADWQAVRDAYVRGEERVADRGDHPDLAGLEFGSV